MYCVTQRSYLTQEYQRESMLIGECALELSHPDCSGGAEIIFFRGALGALHYRDSLEPECQADS